MSSGTTTREQLVSRYERLKKRVDLVKLPDGLQKDLVDVAKFALEMHPFTTEASTSVTMPEPEEVEELLKALLPSPVDVLTDRFFRAPLFAVVSLYQVAEFYGCVSPQEPIYELLGLCQEDRTNTNIAVHVWFADFLGCDRETILASVDRYKATRGSSALIRGLPTAPSRIDPLTEQNVPSRNSALEEIITRAESGTGSVNRADEPVASPARRADIRTPLSDTPSSVAENDVNDSRKHKQTSYSIFMCCPCFEGHETY